VVTGFPILGIFQVFVFIPIIPEILERLQVDLGVVEGEDEAVDNALNDKVNDAYGFVYAFANFVSPLIGTATYDAIGVRATFDLFAMVNFGFGLFIFIFNCGLFVFSENRAFTRKLYDLKSKNEEDQAQKPNAKGRSNSIGFNQAYRAKKDSLYIRPINAKFGFVDSGDQMNQNKLAYRKAQISHYKKSTSALKKYEPLATFNKGEETNSTS